MIDELIEIGKVSGAAGVKGEIKLYHYSGERERLAGIRELFFKSEEESEPYPVDSVRYVGNGKTPIIKSARIADRNAAEALVGKRVFVRQRDLAPLDEDSYYVRDLIGAEVYGADNALLGTVKEIVDNPAHDILVVERESGDFMLPFVDVFITSIQFGTDGGPARVTATLPDGLTEARP
ncbi:MAG: ribosome maturation factor RimM [Clostridiales Family XIII bacterium]|nr:ribosome maturation factor RimM [Clostridiales Family XIII bacterium]